MRTCLALLAAAALLAGCKPSAEVAPAQASLASRAATPPAPEAPKDREVSGSVFIATKGGSVVKLAAVEVKAYEWEAVNKAMEGGRRAAGNLADEARKKAAEQVKQLQELEKALSSAEAATKRAEASTLGAGEASRQAALKPFREREAAARKAWDTQLSQAKETTADLKEYRLLQTSGISGLLGIKDGLLRIATTDADGNFKVKIPGDRQVVFVARTSRLVGRSQEAYTWAHTVPKDEAGPVHLSNANLLPE